MTTDEKLELSVSERFRKFPDKVFERVVEIIGTRKLANECSAQETLCDRRSRIHESGSTHHWLIALLKFHETGDH